jgi:ATP-binding cassette subfamily F protein 3
VLDHQVTVYPGNYEDYLWRKSGGPARTATSLSESLSNAPVAAGPETVAHAASSHSATESVTNGSAPAGHRLNPLKRRKLEERLAALEREVPQAEAALAETEQALGTYVSAEQTQRLTTVLEELRAHHAALLGEWEEVSIALEQSSGQSSTGNTLVITGP